MKFLTSVKVRGWIYRVLVAVGLLLVGYGVLTTNELALWLGVVTAGLNIMPSANTSISNGK